MVDIDYTIKNDTKGFYGAFSKTGKNSAEILSNVRQKERLLNPRKFKGNKKSIINFLKRNGYHNIYGDDEFIKMIKENELDDSQIEEVEEEIDVFQKLQQKKEEEKKIQKPKIVKNPIIKYFHRLNPDLYKYHDLHRQKKHIKTEFKTPNCTKYLPNKDFVWKRTLIPPKWDKLKGRAPLYGIDNTKYYLNHEPPLKSIENIFIDMDKQTMRGDNTISHDLRINSTKKFLSKRKKNKKNKKEDNNQSIIESEYSTFNKTNHNLFTKYENNYIKGKSKRVQSAVTSSTRPQTGHPKNLNTLTSNNSKQINNTSNSIGGKNITSNSKNINSTNVNNLNYSLSEENVVEINSISSSELNDSYNRFKAVYQRQLKPRNNTNEQNKRYSNKSNNNTPLKNKILKIKTNQKIEKNIKRQRPKSSYIDKHNLYLNKNKTNKIFQNNNKNKIKGPDFNKIISREYYENLSDRGPTLIPFSLCNFRQVRERPLSMVIYERPKYKKNKYSRIVGITPDMYDDIYKYLESYNNHKRCIGRKFDKMMSRPQNDNSPLPVYMKGIASRGTCETVNETSLKMNNFANGKFLTNYTSFWPKKSFNKIINLNLLRSGTFLAYLLNKNADIEYSNNYVAKSMKFYHKNYENLLKEGMLSRFDNVTLKTIKSDIKEDFKNMDKVLEKLGIEGYKLKKHKKNK